MIDMICKTFQRIDGRAWSWPRPQPREHLHRLGQHQMGRAHAGGEMELRTSADASEARGTRGDARGDDPHPYCRPDCQSSLSRSVEEMEALQLSRLYFNRLVLI